MMVGITVVGKLLPTVFIFVTKSTNGISTNYKQISGFKINHKMTNMTTEYSVGIGSNALPTKSPLLTGSNKVVT